tara:strand:- start:167564 stop:168265 length:702 start_codon:yes stop_codon:yes gene_type:complete
MKILLLLSIFLKITLASPLDLNFIREGQPFQRAGIILEGISSDDHLIYATRTLAKEPKIVYSQSKFSSLSLKELEITLLFCHELGHFDGGAPFKLRGRTERKSWSSSEGQADYYSTIKCIKEFEIIDMEYTKVTEENIIREINDICKSHKECEMVLSSIYKIVSVYKSWTNEINDLSFFKTNLYPTRATILGYPSNQCRLITLLNGYLCKSYDSLTLECLDNINLRPNCWFSE